MASWTLSLYDPQLSYHPPSPYAENGDIDHDGGYGDILPFFNSLCLPYYSLDPTPLEQDLVSDGLVSSIYGEEDSDYLSRYHKREDLPYNGHNYEDWPTGANFMNGWQEKFFPFENHFADNNEQNRDSWTKEEGMHQTADQQSESYYKEEEAQIPYAYEPLSGYWSWLENQCEKRAAQDCYTEEEPRVSTDELRFYENIFGNWACMSREEPRVYHQFV
ncbi:hypothetical protein SAY87_024155 [Trapa incisa]|uniref:Uncharacterized protein n=1 Tax=Trapa incisa TaxID=236973 RepID=A0AAN7QQY3_9MYRT|nr:hypothetical protein SAY87_024155 [Trapa incisa]